MSSTAVPFHLRPNKHIDRRLFCEVLQILSHVEDVRNYGYVTLGGAFLEDCRMLFNEFGVMKILSFESSKAEFDRQDFNKPFPFIVCRDVSVSAMVADFENELEKIGRPKNIVCWLDFQSPDRRRQLEDIQAVAEKLREFDILRVTMNANISTLSSETDDKGVREALKHPGGAKALDAYRKALGTSFPQEATADDFADAKSFTSVLSRAIYNSVTEGLSDRLTLVPIMNLWYSDGTRMLTTTMTVWPTDKVVAMRKQCGVDSWGFYSKNAGDTTHISVPTLSKREKIELDRILNESRGGDLPGTVKEFFDAEEIEQYRILRRYYPHYERIAI